MNNRQGTSIFNTVHNNFSVDSFVHSHKLTIKAMIMSVVKIMVLVMVTTLRQECAWCWRRHPGRGPESQCDPQGRCSWWYSHWHCSCTSSWYSHWQHWWGCWRQCSLPKAMSIICRSWIFLGKRGDRSWIWSSEWYYSKYYSEWYYSKLAQVRHDIQRIISWSAISGENENTMHPQEFKAFFKNYRVFFFTCTPLKSMKNLG